MRFNTNAGCCIAAIVAVILLPAGWTLLVVTDKEPEYLACRFREGLGSNFRNWQPGLCGELVFESRHPLIMSLQTSTN